MNKEYKTFEELKEELGDKFEEFMYKANIELLDKVNQLETNRDETFKVINTQLKNANEYKDNLRIIKFHLIKGSCTFEDLKTEEDYQY